MERTTLGTKLSAIEKKLGGTGEMPPAGTYDPLLWHLDRIESLIGGGSSGGTKLYKHSLKFGTEGAEGQNHISFINGESSQYTPESFLNYLSGLINGNEILLPLIAGWGNTALSTTEVFNYSMSALIISEEEIGIRVMGYPAATTNTSSLDGVIYNDFTPTELSTDFSDTVTEL